MQITDVPTTEQNQKIKAALYQKEAAIHSEKSVWEMHLWFIPMIFNGITFVLLAVLSLMLISNPYISGLAAFICIYAAVVGIVLTAAGVKKANLKETVIIYVGKRRRMAV